MPNRVRGRAQLACSRYRKYAYAAAVVGDQQPPAGSIDSCVARGDSESGLLVQLAQFKRRAGTYRWAYAGPGRLDREGSNAAAWRCPEPLHFVNSVEVPTTWMDD